MAGYIATWLRAAAISAEEVSGLDPVDAKARNNAAAISATTTNAPDEPAESWHSVYRSPDDVPIPPSVRQVWTSRKPGKL